KANDQPQEAAASYFRSVEVLQQAVADFPSSAELQKALGHHYRTYTTYCTQSSDAADYYGKAAVLFERVAAADASDSDSRYFVGTSKWLMGERLLTTGQRAAAETCWCETVAVAGTMPVEYFSLPPRRGFVNGSFNRLIEFRKADMAFGDAETVYRQAIDFYA